MTRHFKVVVQKELSGGYSAYVPLLAGCASQGETLKDCLANIKEAITLYIESLREDSLPLPSSDPEVILKEVAITF